ncbi:uncharacterized protein LOC130901764 isoform X1 [Diorhabda carinulata]|uniref:uncharacterized protein LOC130449211 isoform X1 n=1 Tax=Diorhabda sublineata TaxID=1163346 RepID=UPI0024E13A3D|nr:uncharacterized protein LOC130449211 isoform X1 [Diorhabda sublineata]XP_057669332.1 uncharacterized protein LOC130901764 isoform X1 [Diorhabda carinulata]
MTKVCRLCLIKLQRGSKYFNINAVESFTGFMPYRDQLTTCIPEMALDLIPNPVICNNCRTALKSAYDFKIRCLFVEKKIQQHIEAQVGFNEISYDLSHISTDDVPPLNKLALLVPKIEETEEPTTLQPEKFLKIQSEEPIPTLESEDLSCSTNKETSDETLNIRPVKSHKPYKHYPRGRVSVNRLYSPTDEFVCNFCNESYKSLQFLRKHNNICSKSTQKETTKNILTKRPHLPTKAKNHLKKWLFRHTDHPYPTDQEKQMLMQETNLSLLQVENWFINARRRILQDLTKLKRRGLRTAEDIYDSPLGLEMDYEDLVPQTAISGQSPEEGINPLEEVDLPAPSEVLVKEEPEDIEEEQVDLAKVKCEVLENR